MTDPVEVMADQIARSVGYINGLMSLPTEGRDKFRVRAQAALSALDAAGFAVVPKRKLDLMEATLSFVHRWAIQKDGNGTSADERLSAIANHPGIAMLSAAQVKP